ncbi:MAG: ArsR family transcriptional regulator, partial [Actinobacteria bacterium]|nr:ArsR family transcriptional regulator [Actinomycetota bacterium]
MRRASCKIFSKSEWAQLAEQLSLSSRQVQIIRLLCDGHKNYSAACALGISPATVRTHLRRLYA